MAKKIVTPAYHQATSWWLLFWQNITSSVSDLHHYAVILNFPLKLSAKLTLGFYLLVAIFLSIKLYFLELPMFEQHAQQFSEEILTKFPQHVQINWDGQHLSTTPPENIEIPVANATDDTLNPDNWLSIDTQQTAEPEGKNSYFVLTQQTLYSLDFQNQYQSFPLTSILDPEPITFTHQSISDQITNSFAFYYSIKNWIPLFMLPIFWLGLFILRTIMVAIDSVILHFLFSLFNRPLPYKKVLQLSWHVLLPAEIIHQLTLLLYPEISFPMLSVAYWVLMLCIMWHFRNLRIVKIEQTEKK